MPIYSQICPLVSKEKIFKELICIIIGKTSPYRDLNYWWRKFVLATLVKGHQMIIYANLQSIKSVSF